MTYQLIRGNALSLPLADESVDLIVTSPPYFALRSYTDSCPDCGGSGSVRPASHQTKECPNCGRRVNEKRCHSCGTSMRWPKDAPPPTPCATCDGKGGHHYEGQLGSEATPQAFLDALWAVTRECVRVLKPSGSMWVNLGDKYVSGTSSARSNITAPEGYGNGKNFAPTDRRLSEADAGGIRTKSLMLLPQRYAIGCIDQLGLILRAEVIWSKPNGLPESVTDRVRRSHEQWFHFTKEPRYFSAVDEVREPQVTADRQGSWNGKPTEGRTDGVGRDRGWQAGELDYNPLGKLPGSVWTDGDGSPLSTMGAVLNAVKDGHLTPEEGERILWDSRISESVSCPMCGKPKADVGNGSGGRITVATARPPLSPEGERTGRTESPTSSSSDPSPTDSTSTTFAATSPASTPTTSKRSPKPRTSDAKPTPTDPPIAPRDTSSSTPTSTATPASAAPASRNVCDCDDSGLPAQTVWSVPTEPLRVPEWLGVDHFAAFPSEFPRRIILGWSPSGVCVECGEGRRPVVAKELVGGTPFAGRDYRRLANGATGGPAPSTKGSTEATITGYACACPTTTAPTTPAVVLDPFSGTGTTPAVAHILGRHGIGVDLSADYLRLAEWRCNDPGLRAKVLRVDKPKAVPDGQLDIFGGEAA